MRKYMASILTIILILMLAGCGTPRTNDSINDYTDFQVVTNSSNRGVWLVTTATASGYYEPLYWTFEMYYDEQDPWMQVCNILYTDYATQTKVFLCSVPGCAHNNENCTSYLRYPHGVRLFTNSTQTQLFCMATGATGGEIYSEDDLGRIYKMDMDGGSRTEIYRLKANENFSSSDVIVADENHLFLCVEVTTDAVGGYKKVLREIDLKTGSIVDHLSLEQMELVVSAYEDVIVIVQLTSESTGKYYGYSPSQIESVLLYEGTGSRMTEKNYLFFVDEAEDGSGVLTMYDTKTGEAKIFENLPLETGRRVSMFDYFDHKVHWSYIDSTEEENDHRYTIDCSTGEVTERTLYYEIYLEGWITRHVPILAEYGDSFLVVMDSDANATITLTNREGIPFVYDWPHSVTYALITKEDYWNNNPNYTIIHDTVIN